MAENDVDSALLVDDKNKICGVFRADKAVTEFWYTWRQRTRSPNDAQAAATLSQLRFAFEEAQVLLTKSGAAGRQRDAQSAAFPPEETAARPWWTTRAPRARSRRRSIPAITG